MLVFFFSTDYYDVEIWTSGVPRNCALSEKDEKTRQICLKQWFPALSNLLPAGRNFCVTVIYGKIMQSKQACGESVCRCEQRKIVLHIVLTTTPDPDHNIKHEKGSWS